VKISTKGNNVLRIFISGIDNARSRKQDVYMERIRFLRRFFMAFFCLYFISFVMLPLVCLTEEISPPGADNCSRSNLPYQSNHSPPAAENKLPCSNNHSCCNFINSNAPNYFIILHSFQLTPIESSPQFLEVTTSVFRPPEAEI